MFISTLSCHNRNDIEPAGKCHYTDRRYSETRLADRDVSRDGRTAVELCGVAVSAVEHRRDPGACQGGAGAAAPLTQL